MTLQWIEKLACRMPVALWLSFSPLVWRGAWRLDKLGQPIDPLDVVIDGNRKLHAVGSGATHDAAHINVWGTNFPMWYDDDARFRFVIGLRQHTAAC